MTNLTTRFVDQIHPDYGRRQKDDTVPGAVNCVVPFLIGFDVERVEGVPFEGSKKDI